MRVIALLASHNRREQTLACLASYFGQRVGRRADLRAVLVDDGSRDGTGDAVRSRYPYTVVVPGAGDLFWARGMALAEQVALGKESDFLLWLNDDVVLEEYALARLLLVAGDAGDECIAVGALCDPETGVLTYSAVRRRGRHPLRVEQVTPTDTSIDVEMFNGNVVLVPTRIARLLGGIDGGLGHGAADFDYCLRAGERGIRSRLAAGVVGTCARLGDSEPWSNGFLSRRDRLRILLGPKGLPPAPAPGISDGTAARGGRCSGWLPTARRRWLCCAPSGGLTPHECGCCTCRAGKPSGARGLVGRL
jgi:GT2 family glycosyltransferase